MAERIDIVVTQKGAVEVRRDLENIGGGADRAASSLDNLNRLLKLVAVGWAADKIKEALDGYTNLSNRLRLVATDAQNLAQLQDAVYRAAQATRVPYAELAQLYARVALNAKQLGLSQQEVLNISTAVAQAVQISGATTNEAKGAILQFTQAVASGVLRGQELNSVMEQAPRLAQAIAKGMGVGVNELRKLGQEGKITSQQVIDALRKAMPELAAEFAKLRPTIDSSLTVLYNGFQRFIGQIDEAIGFSATLASIFIFLGNNMEIVAVAAATLGAALLIVFGPALLAALGTAIASMASFAVATTVATGGLNLIIPLIVGAAAALYFFGDQLKVSSDGVVSLLDYVRAAFQIMMEIIRPVAEYIGNAFITAWNWVKETWGKISEFFAGNLTNVGSIIQTAVGTYIGLWIGLYNAIIAAFQTLPAAFVAIFQQAMNGAIQIVQDGLNAIVSAINTVLEKLAIPLIPQIDLSGFKSEVDAAAVDIAQTRIVGAFNDGLTQGKALVDGMVTGLGAAADALSARARQIAEERRRLEAANSKTLPNVPGVASPTSSDSDSKAIEKLQNQLNSLLRTIDPITGAQEKLRQGTETLNKAYEAGLITLERKNDLLRRLNERLRDQLDPLGKINREMAQEASLLRMGNQEREVQKQLLDNIEKLRKAGVNLSPLETKQMEDQIRALQALKEQSQLLGDVLNRVFKGAEDAFIQFIETGKVSFSDLIRSMISDIARLAFQSFVTKPLVNALQGFMGNILGGLGGTNILGLPTFGLGGAATGGNISPLPTMATGSYTVGGSDNVVDSQVVAFRASKGETVSVGRRDSETEGGGRPQIVFNISTPDVKGFKASETQIAARMSRMAARGNRNL